MTASQCLLFATSTIGKVAAHIPDLIVYGDFSQDVPFIENFDGVLLFADISGFTALTEKFSMDTSMEHGADQLTQTLNHYVGDIVEEVLIHGGDILNFAGDALLALWRVERSHLSHIITLALQCSLSIQEAYGVRETEVGQELRVKIGLSAGHISKVVVGDNKHQYFLVIGRAVDEVRLAQSLANASEVILSPNCWELCDRNMIEIERIKDQRAVKVAVPSPIQNREFSSIGILRKFSMVEGNNELEKCLRKFVMRNILKKIDDNQPLEYLSELRPVTIVFVNLQFDESANTLHLSKAIQDANLHIAELIHSHRGKINKVFMFDKGCTFLCVFGLPGDKQPDETTHALDSAFKNYKYCSAMLMKIKLVSIGVTSGPVFCGVVGHRVRHEYTVIGQKVNLAARMMMHYPGVVSCDATTYTSSRLPNYFFKELPQTEMKGVANPGVVYHYLGISEKTTIGKASLTTERSEYYPLLGREEEINLFQTSLKKFMGSTEGRVIMFEGLMGYGKSQLLTEIAYLGMEAGHKIVAMELTKINVNQNFFGIRALMAMFLGIDACKSYDARQRTLQSKLRDVADETCYCLLNNFFLVKFPISEEVSKMDSEERKIKMEKFLMEILQTVNLLIFVIDEAQFIDSASWEYLENLLSKVPIFMIMALSPFHYRARQPCPSAVNIIKSPQTTYVQLRELKPSVILQKACQDLGVVSIPRELETFLIQRSHGIPYYCEELLRNLYLHNALMFHVLDEEEEIEDEWEKLFSKLLFIYFFTCCEPFYTVVKRIALAEIDNMSPSEQMIVKCAAVIGQNFTTELLFHILPEWTKNKMIQTLAALVEANIFKCFQQGREFQIAAVHDLSLGPGFNHSVQISVANRIRLEQAVMQCSGMGFCMALMQEAAYELWLKSQKEALHHKCAAYLQKQAHKCKRCGEGDFISFHRYAIEMSMPFILKKTNILRFVYLEIHEPRNKLSSIFSGVQGKTTYMASCECEQIVASVFMPLARHCMAIGDEARALYYLLECAAAYLNLSNNYMAFMNLNIAENLIKSLDPRSHVISLFEEATFYSLKGEVCYNMGQMKLAKKMFKKALSLLGRKFPLTSIGVFFKTVTEMSKHASQQKNQPCPEKKLACLYQQNHCLSLLWQIFSQDSANTSRKFSQLAALMSVNSAFLFGIFQIISSYIEYALCCQTIGCQDDWMKYELMAIQRSSHLKLVGGGLLTTIKLAQSLAYIKHCLGSLPFSIELGKHKEEIALLILLGLCSNPPQWLLVVLLPRSQECKQVLQWLEKLAFREEKILARACFFSSCLDLLLYAGWTYKPFKECLEFVQQNETNCILMSQSGIMLGLYSSLAIWFARLQQWDNFREPFEKARRLMRRTSASLFAAHGCCSFLECHILQLHNHAEIKPQKVRETLFSRCCTSPIYYARIYHLKAYVFLMLGDEEQSQFYLEKGLEVSDMYGNILEKSWLEISDEWWFTAREPMEDLWLKTAPDFPTWEGDLSDAEIRKIHRTKYLMRAPALDVDNPFPEEK
uniref:Adenylate cyclase 10 n=1 Tax=Crocodylus porosus TaxID=8502 RepID=A0A7M4EB99_CROPO